MWRDRSPTSEDIGAPAFKNSKASGPAFPHADLQDRVDIEL